MIVVDDDRGRHPGVVEAFGRRTSACSGERRGSARPSTQAWKSRTANCIAFLDADDLWTPHNLELQCPVVERDPAVDVALGEAEQFISPDLAPDQRAHLRPPRAHDARQAEGDDCRRARKWSTGWGVSETDGGRGLRRLAHPRMQLGVMAKIVPEVVLRRRLHESNVGRERTDERAEYAHIPASSFGAGARPAIRGAAAEAPPAIAGRMTTVSEAYAAVSSPSSTRTSSSLR